MERRRAGWESVLESRGLTRRKNAGENARRRDRVGGGLTQTANRSVAHHPPDVVQQYQVARRIGAGARRCNPLQRFFLAHGSNATRNTLTARFLAKKLRDSREDTHEVDAPVERHDDAFEPERRIRGARAPSNDSGIESAAVVTKLPAAPPRRIACTDSGDVEAAGHVEQGDEGRSVGYFIQTGGAAPLPTRQKSRVPVESAGAGLGVRGAAVEL